MLPCSAWPLISPFSSQPRSWHSLLDLEESHLVSVQLNPWLLNQGKLLCGPRGNPICASPSAPVPYARNSRCFNGSELLLSTSSAQWHCHFAWAPLLCPATRECPQTEAWSIYGDHLICFPSPLQFCLPVVQCLKTVASYILVSFIFFSKWQVW